MALILRYQLREESRLARRLLSSLGAEFSTPQEG